MVDWSLKLLLTEFMSELLCAEELLILLRSEPRSLLVVPLLIGVAAGLLWAPVLETEDSTAAVLLVVERFL